MRASTKRLLKKIFANISIGLLIVIYFGKIGRASCRERV